MSLLRGTDSSVEYLKGVSSGYWSHRQVFVRHQKNRILVLSMSPDMFRCVGLGPLSKATYGLAGMKNEWKMFTCENSELFINCWKWRFVAPLRFLTWVVDWLFLRELGPAPRKNTWGEVRQINWLAIQIRLAFHETRYSGRMTIE